MNASRIVTEENMNSKNMVKGVFLALCIFGMLVLPAAAAPLSQTANSNGIKIDQGLADDLASNRVQYRLQEFDMHVTRANSVISILNKYSIDTTHMQSTLNTISSKRSSLETAMTNKDQENIKAINGPTMRTQLKSAVAPSSI